MDTEVQNDTVQAFIDALHAVDSQREPAPLADLVSDDAQVSSIDGHGTRRGPDGMRELFTQYLDQLETVSTTFTRVTEADNRAVLEWTSQVTVTGGGDTSYDGVTVIETGDGKVTDFRTVYDSGALLRPSTGSGPSSSSRQDSDGTDGQDEAGEHDRTGGAGMYNADSGFLPEADRAAATGTD